MQKLDKLQIGQALREIGALLRIKGENTYRAKAYETAATTVEGLSENVGLLIEENRLTEFRGIGASLAAMITELYHTGTSKMLAQLHEQLPPGVAELSQIEGLTLKKIQSLHEQLGIKSIEDLKQACRTGALRAAKGFSEAGERKIRDAIDVYETRDKCLRLIDAIDIAGLLLEHLQRSPAVDQTAIGGEISRWQEVVYDIQVLVSGSDEQRILDHFKKFPYAVEIIEHSKTEIRARLAESGVTVDLKVCQPRAFTLLRHNRTATKEYLDKLQAIARLGDVVFREDHLEVRGSRVFVSDDQEIYKHLNLPFVPVELREEATVLEDVLNGTTYDDLIQIDDLRGMTHCHSTFSDGVASIEEMAFAAKKMNKEYLTMTDHSPTAHYAGGLSIDRLKEQWQAIRQAEEKTGITVYRGTESDILADGSLDYPDDILNQLDVIIASIHSRMKMDEDQMTQRLVNCMRQKQFKIWGHALGRLVLKRDPIKCRVLEVLDAAAQSKAAIEVNGDPHRLDMEPKWLREARKRHLHFVISTDAHSTRDLLNLEFGVHLARRAAIRRHEVLNTLSAEGFREAVKP